MSGSQKIDTVPKNGAPKSADSNAELSLFFVPFLRAAVVVVVVVVAVGENCTARFAEQKPGKIVCFPSQNSGFLTIVKKSTFIHLKIVFHDEVAIFF